MQTVQKVQNNFAQCSGIRKTLIWDHIPENKPSIIKNKIEQLLPLPEKGKTRMMEMRETLFLAIWEQRKYTNRQSMSSLIYVLVTKDENSLEAKEFSCHPVFRTKRCFSDIDGDAAECCMIFIDENGRVYQNWNAFKTENLLPEGFMVAPKNGMYTFNADDCVELEICPTPSSRATSKIFSYTDTTSAVAGLGAAGICAVGSFVAAPVVAGAAVVGAGVGVYSAARSVFNLFDRGSHEQSISLTDSQARNSWLGVVTGTVAAGASGATKLMTSAVAAGSEISMMTRIIVNGMNISSIVFSGAGITSGVLDMILKYQDDEDITVLDVLQLSASLALFTHSLYNFKMASSIIKETRQGTIGAYRDSLSRRQKKMFDKMSKETMRIRGPQKGEVQIIRSINEMPSKQYLNDLYKINKNLNRENIRPSFGGENGKILVNDYAAVDSGALRNNLQHNMGPDVLSDVPRRIPSSHNENANANSRSTQNNNFFYSPIGHSDVNESQINSDNYDNYSIREIKVRLVSGAIFSLGAIAKNIFENVRYSEDFHSIMDAYARFFNQESLEYILQMTSNFIKTILNELHRELDIFIPSESILFHICDYILRHLEDFSLENLIERTSEIFDSLTVFYRSWRSFNPLNGTKKCSQCSGYFSICRI